MLNLRKINIAWSTLNNTFEQMLASSTASGMAASIWLVSPPLWFRLKYLNSYSVDCYGNIHVRQRMTPIHFGDPLTFPLAPP